MTGLVKDRVYGANCVVEFLTGIGWGGLRIEVDSDKEWTEVRRMANFLLLTSKSYPVSLLLFFVFFCIFSFHVICLV